MQKPKGLFCFSPEVMIGTFIIEILLAVYTIIRYKMTTISRLAVATFVCLAVFQLAEFQVCAIAWVDPMVASRVGYVAITLLPALGMHFIHTIVGKTNRLRIGMGYFIAAVFSAFFLIAGDALTGNACQGNYAIFDVAPGSIWVYTLYYYGFLVAGVALCLQFARGAKPHIRKALAWFAVGYLAFMVPTTVVNIIDPSTIEGIPSIMCGFAVLFALILGLKVLPQIAKKR
jgi:hypothetical protein